MTQVGSRRWWALGALLLAVFAVGLDATILSVALPTLAGALHASESDLQWFSSAYLLAMAATILPVGLLGDRYGRKTLLLGALALFGASSAVSAYAPSAGAFIAARVVLGFAGAGITVLALSVLTVLFAEEERPRAIGAWAAVAGLSGAVGPILGGWLLSHYWWGWVFLINVPVTLVGLAVSLAVVPQSRALERPGLDPFGVVASVTGLASLIYGLIEAGQKGWGDASALGPIAAGVAVLVGFFLWERRLGRRPGGQPLLHLALLRSPSFTWGAILLALAGVALFGTIFTLPQYLQGVLGTDAMGSGLRLLPLVGGLVVGALVADRVTRVVGAKVTVATGFVATTAGALVGATTSMGSGYGFVASWTAVLGVGLGLVLATTASVAVSELPADRSGVGAAALQALQKVGSTFGAAVVGSVISSVYLARLDLAGLPPPAAQAVRESVFGGLAVAQQLRSAALLESVRAAFINGFDAALVALAGITVAGLALALAFLPGRAVAVAAARSCAGVTTLCLCGCDESRSEGGGQCEPPEIESEASQTPRPVPG
jgi:DHA2 family multidrug resistance protein-like MFS transporter